MKVAVLGTGNGGCTAAFEMASSGHEVTLFDFEAFPQCVSAVQSKGGIYAEGDIFEGFAPIRYAGHDIEAALKGAEMIFVISPAYSTRAFAEVCRPHLKHGQTVVLLPGSCGGAIEFKNAAGLGLRDESVVIAETSTLPYGTRLVEPGRVRPTLKLKSGVLLAALPAKNTEQVIEQVEGIYPAICAGRNTLHTSLENTNPVLHPAITVANAAQIERTGGDLAFYHEGVTPAVARLVEAVDHERIAIGAALGLTIRSDPDWGCEQGYNSEPTYYPGYMIAPHLKTRAPRQLDHRYFNEDVGYGLVFMHSLGQQIGVETKTIHALIDVASSMMGRDYLADGKRTMQELGLAGYSIEELNRLVA